MIICSKDLLTLVASLALTSKNSKLLRSATAFPSSYETCFFFFFFVSTVTTNCAQTMVYLSAFTIITLVAQQTQHDRRMRVLLELRQPSLLDTLQC